jgi:hypothetical protein
MDGDDKDRDTEYALPNSGNRHLINQAELNDIVQDLNLSKTSWFQIRQKEISGRERSFSDFRNFQDFFLSEW